MTSRSLDDLCPEMKEVCEEFIEQCKDAGIDVLVYCTYRSNEDQNREYAKGRTTEGKITTYKKGGESKHNCVKNGKPASRAFDCVARKGNYLLWSAAVPEWEKMGEIGRGLGLRWGGDWKSFKDRPHFELKD